MQHYHAFGKAAWATMTRRDRGNQGPPGLPTALSFAFGELSLDPLYRPMADAYLLRRLSDTATSF
jgi:hypothetical protein